MPLFAVAEVHLLQKKRRPYGEPLPFVGCEEDAGEGAGEKASGGSRWVGGEEGRQGTSPAKGTGTGAKGTDTDPSAEGTDTDTPAKEKHPLSLG